MGYFSAGSDQGRRPFDDLLSVSPLAFVVSVAWLCWFSDHEGSSAFVNSFQLVSLPPQRRSAPFVVQRYSPFAGTKHSERSRLFLQEPVSSDVDSRRTRRRGHGTEDSNTDGRLMATAVSSSSATSLATDYVVQHQEEQNGSMPNPLPLVILALAGSLTTLLSDVIMHPVDSIKTLQQSEAGLGLNLRQAAQVLWSTGVEQQQQESNALPLLLNQLFAPQLAGIQGFYHGLWTYALSDAAGGALKFSVWELWKQHVLGRSSPDDKQTVEPVELVAARDDENAIDPPSQSQQVLQMLQDLPPWLTLWVGAALAFVASSVFIVPGELLKQQLQMSHYDTVWQAIRCIYEQSALRGFFVGYDGVLLRDVPYTMLELGLYDLMKPQAVAWNEKQGDDGGDSDEQLQVWQEIAAAAVTGAITAFATTPIDVVKTRLMLGDFVPTGAAGSGNDFVDCLLWSVQAHGWTSIFNGVQARVGWIVPYTAIYLPAYDQLKQQLWKAYQGHNDRSTVQGNQQ